MKQIWLALPMCLVLAAPAEAARPTYSHLDTSYLQSEVDDDPSVPGDSSSEATGPRLGLDISLSRWFYFTGNYDQLDFDASTAKIGATSLGFGLHSLKSTFQLFATTTYERLDFSGPGPNSVDEGYGVQLGFRLPMDRFEFQGDYKYTNFGDLPNGKLDDDDRYRGLILAHLTPTVALTGSYEVFEQSEAKQWTAGLRFYFKTRHDIQRKKGKRRAETAAPAAAADPSANQEAETQ